MSVCLTYFSHSISSGKHFVTASYVSEDMQKLHAAAVSKGVVLLNEVGLDPGIDHMVSWHAVLCCAVLCCAVLCCAVLCCAVLCCAVLCCTVLCCAVLCCAVLCCAVLCCAVI